LERINLPYRILVEQWAVEGLMPALCSLPDLSQKQQLLKKIFSEHQAAPCLQCGECCLNFSFTVNYVEYRCLVDFLEANYTFPEILALLEERLGRLNHGLPVCPFFNANRCDVYEARPLMCRQAIAGSGICRSADRLPAGNRTVEYEAGLSLRGILNHIDKLKDVELGLTVQGKSLLTVAPFEIWLLMEAGWEQVVLGLLHDQRYRPAVRWAGTIKAGV
jgi:hypothetical protein